MRSYNGGGGGLVLGVVALWIFSALASLGVTVAIIYVAWHFITKFW